MPKIVKSMHYKHWPLVLLLILYTVVLLCQVLLATFIASRIKICCGDDVYQVPQLLLFTKLQVLQNFKKMLQLRKQCEHPYAKK